MLRAAIQLTTRVLVAGVVFVVAALVPVSASAAAGPTRITLTAQELGNDSTFTTAVLTCDPVGGTHPTAGTACALLTEAAGAVEDVPTQDPHAVCPFIWRPVGVTATGLWQGRPVAFSKTFPNDCVLRSELGALFDIR